MGERSKTWEEAVADGSFARTLRGDSTMQTALFTEATPGKPRLWLVGERNPYGSDPRFALYPLPEHASGGRLARILQLTNREYLRAFEPTNLLTGSWDDQDARRAAELLLPTIPPTNGVVLLGAKVSAAFGVEFRQNLCRVCRSSDRLLLVIPHPSGLSRLWNDPDMAPRVREAVAELRSMVGA